MDNIPGIPWGPGRTASLSAPAQVGSSRIRDRRLVGGWLVPHLGEVQALI